MRIDVVSIFPEYLAPLDLSLPGKAQQRGLLELRVHDLRRWTSDRHRTVDDTPYGGGAGMVMKPEPWGDALDELLDDGAVLVVPTPSGVPFSQPLAAELATEDHLVFACGRYEGIDQRVVEHAATRGRVLEVSIGDYVLNGGEVAAMAIVEAVVRLLPGFMGNAESLAEESHGPDALLEYPVYTKPVSWRGLDVPPVLLSGDHERVAEWRRAQALRRTAERRPDLLHAGRLVTLDEVGEAEWRTAERADAGELLTLRRACGVEENPERGSTTFVLRAAGRLLGSVRARLDGTEWVVDQLMVVPDLGGAGLTARLLEAAEAAAAPDARTMSVVTGAHDDEERRVFRRAGFRPTRDRPDPQVTRLRKRLAKGPGERLGPRR